MKDLYSYMYEAKTSPKLPKLPKLKSGRYNAGNARINVETGMVTITAPGYVSLETYTFKMKPKDFITLIQAVKDGNTFEQDFKMIGKSRDWDYLSIDIDPRFNIIIMKNHPKNWNWSYQQSNISLSGFKDTIDEMVETI